MATTWRYVPSLSIWEASTLSGAWATLSVTALSRMNAFRQSPSFPIFVSPAIMTGVCWVASTALASTVMHARYSNGPRMSLLPQTDSSLNCSRSAYRLTGPPLHWYMRRRVIPCGNTSSIYSMLPSAFRSSTPGIVLSGTHMCRSSSSKLKA